MIVVADQMPVMQRGKAATKDQIVSRKDARLPGRGQAKAARKTHCVISTTPASPNPPRSPFIKGG
jgi:hypothetical protein